MRNDSTSEANLANPTVKSPGLDPDLANPTVKSPGLDPILANTTVKSPGLDPNLLSSMVILLASCLILTQFDICKNCRFRCFLINILVTKIVFENDREEQLNFYNVFFNIIFIALSFIIFIIVGELSNFRSIFNLSGYINEYINPEFFNGIWWLIFAAGITTLYMMFPFKKEVREHKYFCFLWFLVFIIPDIMNMFFYEMFSSRIFYVPLIVVLIFIIYVCFSYWKSGKKAENNDRPSLLSLAYIIYLSNPVQVELIPTNVLGFCCYYLIEIMTYKENF